MKENRTKANRMGNIVKDYFGVYKMSRLKERKTDGLFFLAYFIAMPVLIGVSGNVNFRWEYAAGIIGILLPMGLLCVDALFHSPALNKMMYLCPMSRDERKQYIYNLYYFGVAIRMLIFLMGVCIIIPFSHCDIFSAVLILLNDSLIAILVSCEKKREGDVVNKEIVLQTWLMASALISNIVETAVVADELPDFIVKLALLGIFVIVQLPMAVKYGRYVKQRLNDAVYYETRQRRTA